MWNEGLCTKTGPLNHISYPLTRRSKYIYNPSSTVYVPEVIRALYLTVFCINRTANVCYDFIRINIHLRIYHAFDPIVQDKYGAQVKAKTGWGIPRTCKLALRLTSHEDLIDSKL